MTEKSDTEATSAAGDLPAWFDQARHVHRDNGIYERETGLFLASDGLPFAGAARLGKLVAAGATTDPLGILDDDMIAGAAAHAANSAEAEQQAEQASAGKKAAKTKAAGANATSVAGEPRADQSASGVKTPDTEEKEG